MSRILQAAVAVGALAIGGLANAADLPVRKAPAYAPAAVFSWTGFYFGAHAGGGWGKKAWFVPDTDPAVDIGYHNVKGGLVGGQVGFNYQVGYWVFGAEAQASWSNLKGEHSDLLFTVGGEPTIDHTRVDALATFAGRFGYAMDRVMFYLKGGWAWADDSYKRSTATLGTYATGSEDRWGWMAGGGIEYAFADNWSAKVEYNYMNLGTERVAFECTIVCAVTDRDIRQELHILKVGINYRFGYAAPVVARY